MLLPIRENHATFNERLQNTEIYFLIRPLIFGKEGCVFILLIHDVDLSPALMDWIIAPLATERSELHRRFTVQQYLLEILLTGLFKHLPHMIG